MGHLGRREPVVQPTTLKERRLRGDAYAQYQVTMSLEKADPLLNLGDLTEIVEQAILPSLRALEDLQSKGKILAGGPTLHRHVHGCGVGG